MAQEAVYLVIGGRCCIIFILLLAMSFLVPQIAAADPNVLQVRSAILVDLSGAVLFEQNADKPIPPASITKVLSLYLAFEAVEDGRVRLADIVTVSPRAAAASPVRMGLKAGDRVALEELIKGMAVVSGNDAAIAVAEHVGGTVDNFARQMNLKARQLGMWNSHFVNPNGLPAAGQITTARDIAVLSIAYLKRFPHSLDIHCLQTYTYKSVTRHNANRLLGSCPGVDGLKTGFVNASGYNLSATAMRDGRRLIAVVLGGTSPGVRNRETARLLEYGFTGAFPPAVTKVAKSSRGKSATKSAAVAKKAKGGQTTKTAAAAKKSKSGKATTTAATAGKKLASTAKEQTKTSAKQAGSKEKKSGSSSTAKQTTAANKTDKQKAHSVQQQKQIKAESKTSVRKKIEKPSKEKKNTEPAKT